MSISHDFLAPGFLEDVFAVSVARLAASSATGAYAGALASLGRAPETVYSNSAVVAHPALQPLTDIFAIPHGIPFANVFSVGDMLIGLGVAIVIVVAMRQVPGPAGGPPPDPSSVPS